MKRFKKKKKSDEERWKFQEKDKEWWRKMKCFKKRKKKDDEEGWNVTGKRLENHNYCSIPIVPNILFSTSWIHETSDSSQTALTPPYMWY